MDKQDLPITGRVLIVAQIMWAFIALFVAVEMSDGLLYTLIGFISLCVPIWAFYGICWTLVLQRLPLWTLVLFLPLLALAISPFLLNDYQYNNDYAPFYLLAAPVAFVLFRYLRNRQYASQTIIEDTISCASGCLDFLRQHPRMLKNTIYVVFIIAAALFSVHNVNAFIEKNRPEEYQHKIFDSYDQKVLLSDFLKDRQEKNQKWHDFPIWERFALSYDYWRKGGGSSSKSVENE